MLALNVFASEVEDIKDYLLKLDQATIDFEQYDQNNVLYTGRIFFKDNKIRIEYDEPKVILIIKDKKFIYYDVELDQISHFFNHDAMKLNVLASMRNNALQIRLIDKLQDQLIVQFVDEDREFLVHFNRNPLQIKSISMYEVGNLFADVHIKKINTSDLINNKLFSIHKKKNAYNNVITR